LSPREVARMDEMERNKPVTSKSLSITTKDEN
jgi:hypothetical protein